MGTSRNMIGGRGKRSGGRTSNHGGGWSNIALNGSLGVRTSRNLRRGKRDKLPTLALTFEGSNLLLNGWRSWNLFFRLFF
jgi:hypothetical protein